MTAWNKYNIEVNDWDNLLKIKFNENIKTEGKYCDVVHVMVLLHHFLNL